MFCFPRNTGRSVLLDHKNLGSKLEEDVSWIARQSCRLGRELGALQVPFQSLQVPTHQQWQQAMMPWPSCKRIAFQLSIRFTTYVMLLRSLCTQSPKGCWCQPRQVFLSGPFCGVARSRTLRREHSSSQRRSCTCLPSLPMQLIFWMLRMKQSSASSTASLMLLGFTTSFGNQTHSIQSV